MPTYSFPAMLGTSGKGEEVHRGFAESLSLASARGVWNKAIIPLLDTVSAHHVRSGCTFWCRAAKNSPVCSCTTIIEVLYSLSQQLFLSCAALGTVLRASPCSHCRPHPDPSAQHIRRRNTRCLQSQRQGNDKFCLCREFARDYYHFKGQATAPSTGSQGFE